MPRKPTTDQRIVLDRIERGVPREHLSLVFGHGSAPATLEVNSYQWSRDGESVLAHRTVLREETTGNPRLDYRTELFRISPDGVVRRL